MRGILQAQVFNYLITTFIAWDPLWFQDVWSWPWQGRAFVALIWVAFTSIFMALNEEL